MRTVFSLTPLSDRAKEWIEKNTQYESYQKLGNSLVIEHRYIADIVAGLIEEGFITNKDFRVS